MALTGPDGVTWLPLYVGEAVSVGPGVRVNVRVNVGAAVRVREGDEVGPKGVFVKVGPEVVDFFVGVGDRYRVGVLLVVGYCVAPCKVFVEVLPGESVRVPVRVVIGETEGLGDISVVTDGEMPGSGVMVRGKKGVMLGGGVRDSVGVTLAVGGKIYPAISRGIRQAAEIVA